MKSSITLDEAKSKNHQATLLASVGEIRRVAEANQLRLQHLEHAVTNLTSICSALRNDLHSLGLYSQGSYRKVQVKAIDMKTPVSRSSSTSMELRGDMLGHQMQQLVKQATALGILKDGKSSPVKLPGNVKANPKATTRPGLKNMQATTNQKRSARARVQTTELTTEKKMSMKIAPVKNIKGASPLKGSPRNSVNTTKPTPTAKVSLKSTVKKTKTTISKVYVESSRGRGKEVTKTRGNVRVNSPVKNVETVKGKGSSKLTINTNQASNSPSAANSRALAITSSAATDLKPRRQWSTAKEITLKK